MTEPQHISYLLALSADDRASGGLCACGTALVGECHGPWIHEEFRVRVYPTSRDAPETVRDTCQERGWWRSPRLRLQA
jgi:hypothetical protein